MHLPSIYYLSQAAIRAFKKYPLVLFSAILGAILSIYMVEMEAKILDKFPILNCMLTAALGIPLFFSMVMYVSKNHLSDYKKWILNAVVLVFLTLVYISLPDVGDTLNISIPYIRYTIFNLTAHLIVAFVPFLNKGELNGFWNYNKMLFIRFWQAVLYSVFLYVGLILALSSLDWLFDVDIHKELYFDIFIFIMGVFNTWFYVAGMPENLDGLEKESLYPHGLKIFTQYILMPLLILYLSILYVYGLKVVGLWDWPKGMVSYLVICVAVLGILNLLLIHPYGYWLKGNEWIVKFSKLYYFLLFPLVLMLFIAIGMRIGDYGITINRYIILLLGIWLSVVCLVFSLNKGTIKFIPISLALMMILTSFGPWGMFAVAEKSQVNRLETILKQANLLVDGKVKNEVVWEKDSLPNFNTSLPNTNAGVLPDSLHNEVYSIIEYLNDYHGFTLIRHWYTQDIYAMLELAHSKNERWSRPNESDIYMRSLGLPNEYKYTSNDDYYTYALPERLVLSIDGYQYMYEFNAVEYDQAANSANKFVIGDKTYELQFFLTNSFESKLISEKDTAIFQLRPTLDILIDKYGHNYEYQVRPEEMVLKVQSENWKLKMQVEQLSITIHSDTLVLNDIVGKLFIDLIQ